MEIKNYSKEIDEEFIKLLEDSYSENSDFDEQMADKLSHVSWEVDNILKGEIKNG